MWDKDIDLLWRTNTLLPFNHSTVKKRKKNKRKMFPTFAFFFDWCFEDAQPEFLNVLVRSGPCKYGVKCSNSTVHVMEISKLSIVCVFTVCLFFCNLRKIFSKHGNSHLLWNCKLNKHLCFVIKLYFIMCSHQVLQKKKRAFLSFDTDKWSLCIAFIAHFTTWGQPSACEKFLPFILKFILAQIHILTSGMWKNQFKKCHLSDILQEKSLRFKRLNTKRLNCVFLEKKSNWLCFSQGS